MNWPFDRFAVSQLHLWRRDPCLWLISPEMLIHIVDIAKQEKQNLGLPTLQCTVNPFVNLQSTHDWLICFLVRLLIGSLETG